MRRSHPCAAQVAHEVFVLLAAFPKAKVILTVRRPSEWAEKRRRAHPSSAMPLTGALDSFRRVTQPGVSAREDSPVEDRDSGAPLRVLDGLRLDQRSAREVSLAFALANRLVTTLVDPENLCVVDVFGNSSVRGQRPGFCASDAYWRAILPCLPAPLNNISRLRDLPPYPGTRCPGNAGRATPAAKSHRGPGPRQPAPVGSTTGSSGAPAPKQVASPSLSARTRAHSGAAGRAG